MITTRVHFQSSPLPEFEPWTEERVTALFVKARLVGRPAWLRISFRSKEWPHHAAAYQHGLRELFDVDRGFKGVDAPTFLAALNEHQMTANFDL